MRFSTRLLVLLSADGEQRLIVHLTNDGLVTDVDTADE
jgi:hypothetical protein